jgi:hypothetical protein
MTKKELIYSVKNRIAPGGETDDTRFHPQEIENILAKYRSHFLKSVPKNELDYYAKQYTADVETDATNGRNYVDLPVQIEDLPGVNKGVVSVTTTQGTDAQFYPMTERDRKMGAGLEVDSVRAGRTGYVVYYDRIEFDGEITPDSVRMMLIPTFDEYSLTENVPLAPFEREILELATNYLLGIPEPELKNN